MDKLPTGAPKADKDSDNAEVRHQWNHQWNGSQSTPEFNSNLSVLIKFK